MIERTLREKIIEQREDGTLMTPDQRLAWDGAFNRVLAVLDAHTAEQPAPELCDVCGGHGMAGHPDSGYLCSRCHGSGGIKPAPDAVAEAWQPIETAPKDGTWVLGFRPRIAVQDQIQCYCWNAFGCTDDLWVNATDTNDFDEQPTHWQPLPAPPAKGHQP